MSNSIGEPTVTYNTAMKERQLDKLRELAHDARKGGKKGVSTASLIRDAVDLFLEQQEGNKK